MLDKLNTALNRFMFLAIYILLWINLANLIRNFSEFSQFESLVLSFIVFSIAAYTKQENMKE